MTTSLQRRSAPARPSREGESGGITRGEVLVLVALTAAGAFLRFATLDTQSFWFDEAITVGLLRLDLWHMLSALPHSESTPPLYYLAGWGWAKLFGTGEVGLRSLSALCGTALVPVAYRAGALVLSRRTGLFAAALVAFNPLLVWYSQEARAYALLTLLCGLSFALFLSFLKTARGPTLAWWALVSALALATHYFAAFLIVPEAVWMLATRRLRPAVWAATGAVSAAGVALLPLALVQRSHGRTDSITAIPLTHRVVDLVKHYAAGLRTPPVAMALPAGLLLLVALVLLLTRAGPREKRAAVVAGAMGVAAIAVPLVLALGGLDYFITRNLLGAALPITLVAAIGFGVRRAPRLGLAAAVATCAVYSVIAVATATDADLQRDDWR
ncbi:MAG TPA: glycosyltransferase family 39 protein, partial [Thermoleophilaceae bacterium]